MRATPSAWVLAVALGVVLACSATALGAEPDGATLVSRSGPEAFLEHLDRVEVSGDGAVVVFDVEGEEHGVEVDLTGVVEDMRADLRDDETGLVDLAVVPLAAGAFVKLAGYLLRLGRLQTARPRGTRDESVRHKGGRSRLSREVGCPWVEWGRPVAAREGGA